MISIKLLIVLLIALLATSLYVHERKSAIQTKEKPVMWAGDPAKTIKDYSQ
jgi:hypothetical protein